MQNIDQVANRLKKRLEIIWDRSADEIEELIKYDPVVKLLFYSVIYQYEEVIIQQENYQKEIIANLAKRLLPDVKFNSSPSFGILKSYPTGNEIIELAQDKTFFNQRVINEKIVPLNFIPAFKTEIVPAKLLVIANNKFIFDLTAKEENRIAKINNVFENSEYYIWLGLQINPKALKKLNKLRLYFDYDVTELNNRLFFNELRYANWVLNKNKCVVSEGFSEYSDYDSGFISETSNFGDVKNRVANFYARNFINLYVEEEGETVVNPDIPKDREKNLTDITWIQIKTQSALPIDFFIENAIHLNAFPVINCDVKKDRLTKNEIAKQFDLNEGEYFFDLWNVDKDNEKFRIRDVRLNSFDYRDISSELRVLDRLFNQSRVLFDTNLNMEDDEMNVFREFSNIISDLKIRLKKEKINYPIYHIESNEEIKEFKPYRYLSTFGENGNGGEVGSKFGYNSPGLVDKETIALSKFYGGRNQIEEDDLVDQFRYSLISRGKIVTKQDIKALVFSTFGKDLILKLEVKKDVISGIGRIGLSRAIKITIYLADKKISNELLDFYKKDLVTQLEMNAVMGVNFIIDVIQLH